MTNKEKDASRLETVLAFSFIASVAVSVLAVLVILLAAFSNNAWIPTGLGLVPMLALPFGMLCLIAVLVLSARRKKKEQAK
jgi:hydrogenase-4 membrane subunit HyfE